MLEFAVIITDKGEAVDILRDQHDASAVVFFGDDVTDEKAFRRMRERTSESRSAPVTRWRATASTRLNVLPPHLAFPGAKRRTDR